MNKIISLKGTINIISRILNPSMHKKRKGAIGRAVFGALHAERLMISKIGRSLAHLNNTTSPKHTIKAIDKLMGNEKFDITECFQFYVPWLVAHRPKIIVTLDWTEFCYMGHQTLSVNLVTKHGRATPLIWKSYDDTELKGRRVRYEKAILSQLKTIVPSSTKVIVLADRGFSNTMFFKFIEGDLGWDYVIRIKNNMYVYAKDGTVKYASAWVPKNGRILELPDALVTESTKTKVGSMVFVKKRGMKDAWHIATTLKYRKENVVSLYNRRFTCEENFRDLKDDRYGSGFKETIVTTKERRERLIMIHALTVIILTILGAVGERLGYDRKLRANTVKHRTHSLYRQGKEYIKGVMDVYVSEFERLFRQLVIKHRHTKTILNFI
jgi:hypothetical protein